VAKALAAQGAQVDYEARPSFSAEDAFFVYSGLLFSAMAARLPDAAYQALVEKAQALDPKDDSPYALQLRAQTMTARDWAALNERRSKMRWAWREFFQTYDVLLTPIMPTTAFPHDHKPEHERTLQVDDEVRPYMSQLFWAGLSGGVYLPSTMIPAGPAADGLPVGVQMIGPAYSDLKLIDIAQKLEEAGFSFRPPPGYDA